MIEPTYRNTHILGQHSSSPLLHNKYLLYFAVDLQKGDFFTVVQSVDTNLNNWKNEDRGKLLFGLVN